MADKFKYPKLEDILTPEMFEELKPIQIQHPNLETMQKKLEDYLFNGQLFLPDDFPAFGPSPLAAASQLPSYVLNESSTSYTNAVTGLTHFTDYSAESLHNAMEVMQAKLARFGRENWIREMELPPEITVGREKLAVGLADLWDEFSSKIKDLTGTDVSDCFYQRITFVAPKFAGLVKFQ